MNRYQKERTKGLSTLFVEKIKPWFLEIVLTKVKLNQPTPDQVLESG